MEPHRAGTYMENSCKAAVHSRDLVTYRPTPDQLRGRNMGRSTQGGALKSTQGRVLREEHSKMNTQGSTWKRRTLEGALRGKHVSRST